MYQRIFMAGALGICLGFGAPVSAQTQGMILKPGWNYAIGFPDGGAPGSGVGKGVVTYRVLGAAGDQQWYKVRMVARAPQGGWVTPPGAADVWINLNYAMWVQEVLR
jgi:hypothetical protein